MTGPSYSLSALEAEIAELRKDYTAFGKAYDLMRKRILESNELSRKPELHTWSGTRAVVGSLEMAIHSIERTILEYDALIQKVRCGEIQNMDVPAKPKLSLVKETDTP